MFRLSFLGGLVAGCLLVGTCLWAQEKAQMAYDNESKSAARESLLWDDCATKIGRASPGDIVAAGEPLLLEGNASRYRLQLPMKNTGCARIRVTMPVSVYREANSVESFAAGLHLFAAIATVADGGDAGDALDSGLTAADLASDKYETKRFSIMLDPGETGTLEINVYGSDNLKEIRPGDPSIELPDGDICDATGCLKGMISLDLDPAMIVRVGYMLACKQGREQSCRYVEAVDKNNSREILKEICNLRPQIPLAEMACIRLDSIAALPTNECTGYECGSRGTAYCGSCLDHEQCKNNMCRSCLADCSGKQCGDDGCGGSCGQCGGESKCTSGRCVSTVQAGKLYASADATDWNYRYKKPARYHPDNVLDGDVGTAWCKTGTGESITLSFSGSKSLVRVWFRNGYQKNKPDNFGDRFYHNSRPSLVVLKFSDGTTHRLQLQDIKDWQSAELAGVMSSSVTVEVESAVYGEDDSVCISEIQVDGR